MISLDDVGNGVRLSFCVFLKEKMALFSGFEAKGGTQKYYFIEVFCVFLKEKFVEIGLNNKYVCYNVVMLYFYSVS